MYLIMPKFRYHLNIEYYTTLLIHDAIHSVLVDFFSFVFIICKNDNKKTKFIKRPYERLDGFDYILNSMFKVLFSKFASMSLLDLYHMIPENDFVSRKNTTRLIRRTAFKR
jgi:hypothetical protein